MSDATWEKASSLRTRVHDFDKHTAELAQTKMLPQSSAGGGLSSTVNAWGEVSPPGGHALGQEDKRDIAMSLLDMPVPGGASSAGELGGGTNVFNRSYFSTYARRRVMAAASSKLHVQAPEEQGGGDNTQSPLQRGLALLQAQQAPAPAVHHSLASASKKQPPVTHADRGSLLQAVAVPSRDEAEVHTPVKDAFIDTVETVLQDEEHSIAQHA